MIPKLEIGMSWGHVRIIGTGEGDLIIDEGGGCKTQYKNRTYYMAKCDCGTEFKLWPELWKGKKYHKDCGCGLSFEDGRNVIKTFMVPIALDTALKQWAQDHTNGNVSRAIVELIKTGMGDT